MNRCSNCGEDYSGNFCPNCGSPARPSQQGVVDTFWKGSGIEENIGFVSTVARIAASPISNTLVLANAVNFNQKSFLIKCIAIASSIGILSKVQETYNLIGVVFSASGILVFLFVQILITYYGFCLFSSTTRAGGDYSRFICIAQGVAFLFMGVGEMAGLAFGLEIYFIAMVAQTFILVPYWALTLGRFWNMNAFFAYMIYLLSMLPPAGIVYYTLALIYPEYS